VKLKNGYPLKRIALALVLSTLVHILLLWQWPEWKLTSKPEQLPPLQATLEPLPKLVKKSIEHRPKTKAAPSSPNLPQPFPAPISEGNLSNAPPAQTTVESAALSAIDMAGPPPPTLPKHAQLRFSVQYGNGSFKVGEIIHELKISDGHYTLHAETQTTGLTKLFKSYSLTQNSRGTITAHGLQPDYYEEIKKDSSKSNTSNAHFDWPTGKVFFADGRNRVLLEQTQDTLSLPYQLSQLPLNMEMINISIFNGKDIAHYQLTIGNDEKLETPMGTLHTIAMHKVNGPNEDGLIIWLALEYRLLPVKILYFDKSGEVAANMIITDIRVSDE
jgi:hypothetical protein